ncbi:CCR4-NOT transcription complex subunit 10 [Schistocerca nitens]|uniref:CCR4-NOT transcription complex subunit 10 n=1 Tax=Schistocerca nitens TaxID=7011 RepID=UPI002119529E|nr:CCR4-NOT transcription complex subunit 10 [Schistocerca nitens]
MAEREAESEKSKTEAASTPVISEQEREWAQAALADFNKGNFSSCIQYLAKLEAARPQDIKVLHNKAVAEYYKSELKKTDLFRKNMNLVCSQAHINIEDLDSLEDVEHCVIYYNQAVLLYHLKQYHAALKIMNKIFSFIEPMEESLAHRVCLLVVELHLCTYQPEKALTLIAYIENQFVSTDTVISSEKEIKPLEKEHKEKKAVSVDAATDAFHLKLLQYRARCFLLTHTLKACKREIKNLVTSGGRTMATAFLKGNLEYLRGNYRKAIKALSSVPQNTLAFKDCGESTSVLFYNNNGCIHHYMGKPNLACFYMQKAFQENENALNSLSKPEPVEPYSGRPLFTLGSSRFYELKYNLGICLLHAGKAVQAFDCLIDAVQVYHMNPRLWLRLAECCIMAHKSSNEHDFNIHARRKDLVQKVIGAGCHRKIVLASSLNASEQCAQQENQSPSVPSITLEFAALCLRNTLVLLPALDAASSIVPPLTTDTVSVTDNTVSGETCSAGAGANSLDGIPPTPAGVYAAPTAPMAQHEVASLRCSTLAAAAYVSLCLGDFITALQHSRNLLKQPRLSGAHQLLGHLYCAEALILLDKISEAVEHLQPDCVKDLSLISPAVEKEGEKDKYDVMTDQSKPLKQWFPTSVPTARVVLQYNLAVAFAIRGELDKAGETLKQVWTSKSPSCDVPIHAIMLALYIELQLGHADVARSILKQHSPQYR